MIGLCHACYSSNVEIQLVEDSNVCKKCMDNPEIIKTIKKLQ